LVEAAVATGAWAIPEKLPAPELGTEEHAAPKSVPAMASVAAAEVMGALPAVGELVVDEATGLELLELHAASPAPSTSAATAAGTRRRVVRVALISEILLGDGKYELLLPLTAHHSRHRPVSD
jgi:hypothetical protein